ncbi:chorismate mutase [Bifidobacterium bohemicum]|uniref:Chorismate mutase n=1 Tax=Bifidobacterium bohemicum DSM 22767 TaxID=1437606 RepID=A0A086ZHI9_9BIFI|nr:chorismate mutase [Bifidobacterium bohemicum]KFI45989.1 chorismate mutase [Bifidobacterium bohemicum DSM 22767]SCC04003.1 chorismate mutase [Bifidobacterium bohemicum]
MNDRQTSGTTDWQNTTIDDTQARQNPDIAREVVRIEQLRHSVDVVDDDIVRLLAQRFSYTEEIGRLKADAGFAPQDPGRERSQSQRLRHLADENGLDPAIAQEYLRFVVTAAKKRHQQIMDDSRAAVSDAEGVNDEHQ